MLMTMVQIVTARTAIYFCVNAEHKMYNLFILVSYYIYI